MLRKIFILSLLTFLGNVLFANGVVFQKSESGSYLRLTESITNVSIESQVATTISSQTFLNNIGDSIAVKYAFPLPENASATQLRYKIGETWYAASFAPVPQDTTTGGEPGEEDWNLKTYLGLNPVYFDIIQKILIMTSTFDGFGPVAQLVRAPPF